MSRYGAQVRIDPQGNGRAHLWVIGRLGVLYEEPIYLDPDHTVTRSAIGYVSEKFDVPAADIRQAIVERAKASQQRGEATMEAHAR